MLSADKIDRAIMAATTTNWLKVARIVAIVGQDAANDSISYEYVATRIALLVKEGRLESRGNLQDWRHSEVRLAAKL